MKRARPTRKLAISPVRSFSYRSVLPIGNTSSASAGRYVIFRIRLAGHFLKGMALPVVKGVNAGAPLLELPL